MAKILILDCDYDLGEDSTAEAIMDILKEHEIIRYRVCENEFPKSLDFTHIIITGSSANPDENFRWITETEKIIKELLLENKPILGICFGHQMLCRALGAKIEKMNEKELGIKKINITNIGITDSLFKDVRESTFFLSHSYCVKNTIIDINILAENEYGIQAIKYANAYGVQFHPEIEKEFAQRIMKKYNNNDKINVTPRYDSERINLLKNFIGSNDDLGIFLKNNKDEYGLVLDIDYRKEKSKILDFSKNNNELLDMDFHSEKFTRWINNTIMKNGAKFAIGKYNEDRMIYQQSSLFKGKESRTIHLGIDLCVPARTKVYAPIDGIIHSYKNNNCKGDYGPTIILEHNLKNRKFYTLYGHLSLDSLDNVYKGQKIKKEEQIGCIGNSDENGNWNPHLHFQIIDDMLGKEGDFYGVINQSQRNRFIKICPNPNIILQIPSLSN